MAVDEKKVKEAVKVARENPFWKSYYDNAPTNDCKRYIALDFYYSVYFDYESIKEEVLKLKNSMTLPDYQHLQKYEANNPLKAFYRNKIIELGGKDPWKRNNK